MAGGDPWVAAAVTESSCLDDCNADGTVNAGQSLPASWTLSTVDVVLNALNTLPGDLDGKGEVDFADFLVLSVNFGKTPVGVPAIPEPRVWIIAFDFLNLVVFRRHRRR